MVLFGVEQRRTFYRNVRTECLCLVITTNEITNEILGSIDTDSTKKVCFRIPLGSGLRDRTFDFKADIWAWNRFVRNIEHLEFAGPLVKNQLNVEHFEEMLSIKYLHIGSTNYALFDKEDVSKLPMIPYILLNGYGLVLRSENMEKWLEKLTFNDCMWQTCF